MKQSSLLVPFLALTFFTSGISAQLNERDRGIELYKQGDNKAAISIFEKINKQKEFRNDGDVWNYAGLAYLNNDESKKARKALEKAVKLDPQNSVYRSNLAYVYLLIRKIDKSQSEAEKALKIDSKNVFAYYVMGTANLWEGKLVEALSSADKIFPLNPSFPQAYMLKADVLVAQLGKRVAEGRSIKEEIDFLKRSVEVLEIGVKNSVKDPDLKMLQEKLEGVAVFYDYYKKDRPISPGVTPVPEPGVTPLRILSKPKASYTDNARASGKSGTVRLAILLGANGKIQYILKLWGVGYGLDEQAIRAARQIRFEPKMRDGKPVSTVVIMEYAFNIY